MSFSNMKTLIFTLVLLSGVTIIHVTADCHAEANRVDCGFLGINATQCQASGCCWSPVNPNPNNLPWCFVGDSPACQPNAPRTDCGYVGIDEQSCINRGCCWQQVDPNPNNLPWCFTKASPPSFYSLSSLVNTSCGWQGVLTLNGTAQTPYGNLITPLALTVEFQSQDRVHVKIYDPNNQRWEIPDTLLPRPDCTNPANLNYKFQYNLSPFSLQILRVSDNSVVFDSSPGSLFFADQYIEISTAIAQNNPNVYGIGEHRDPLRLYTNNHIYTLWNRDTPTPVDQNLYGSHPFFIELVQDANGGTASAHGVFMRNSNGMDVVVNPGKLSYRMLGGVIDLYIFNGPNPSDVIAQYQEVIPKPHMPPYWALGWHQCKYGYPNVQWLQQVVANYSAAGIPLDTIWSDIDHMDNKEDFSFDPVNYPTDLVKSFVSQLHENGQNYVVIVDPGIHIRPGYPAYDDGKAMNIFIKEADGVTDFQGVVWPGNTNFPDFLNPNAQTYWTKEIGNFLSTVPIDGLWIDMNEISNFQNGQPTSNNPVNNPPYNINNCGNQCPLNTKTLSMDALHHGGVFEYNAHNLFGFTEAIATKTALETYYNRRSFVLSRSSFPGSGAYTAHWSGDNFSDWDSMAESVRQIMAQNLFGIPFVGSDICGFLGTTNEELCARWTAVGAFYTFARNHDDIHSPPQEPYLWASVTAVAKKVLAARYSLLPYYYTLFYQAHTQGGTVLRPLWFEFAADPVTPGLDTQFLVGSSLMISPVLTQGANSLDMYFPSAFWYSYWSGIIQSTTGWQTIQTPLDFIPVHIRGGAIIPTQQPDMTTAATRKNPFTLIVAPDASASAKGSLFWDDGLTLDIGTSALFVSFSFSQGTLSSQVVQATYPSTPALDYVVFYGVPSVNNVTLAVNGGAPSPYSAYSFNHTSQILSVNSLNINLGNVFTLTFA